MMSVIAVSSGSVTVNNDSSVQILAEEAIAMENIDAQVCVVIAGVLCSVR